MAGRMPDPTMIPPYLRESVSPADLQNALQTQDPNFQPGILEAQASDPFNALRWIFMGIGGLILYSAYKGTK